MRNSISPISQIHRQNFGFPLWGTYGQIFAMCFSFISLKQSSGPIELGCSCDTSVSANQAPGYEVRYQGNKMCRITFCLEEVCFFVASDFFCLVHSSFFTLPLTSFPLGSLGVTGQGPSTRACVFTPVRSRAGWEACGEAPMPRKAHLFGIGRGQSWAGVSATPSRAAWWEEPGSGRALGWAGTAKRSGYRDWKAGSCSKEEFRGTAWTGGHTVRGAKVRMELILPMEVKENERSFCCYINS